ncbi:pyruvate dehydrogenase complex dihydrolipoyllysine-residue acetyltransferase [Oceanospirillum linum]|uniref:Acetyltransferase component of pyruvate dehydrogenase complex n=1 Tax=Oceanospirillum linum TaxID=966 RepID=A0A1T1H9P4_OCELI|nr:pyruvate dehydrogenase complex dihydrolipoyllysine-residue acetyltransferase [Oceanospirillum linum]OOV86535.1 pyruvate dehydrogenase complex dihydrolipoyllysine-residue acetyltransferase [Oceanospirillum linum]SEG36047.1 pyruvate dehydrogenase E2 component (dihydrolipoamide acetyltransferase) [Oleiphilus messinensis]SMP29992.1 pyruvate dehydrogenase E2 component (dihydrolipoamide acetyltransferase) [Oceanospirillum linum]
MSTEIIKVPDIGGDSDVEVIEVCVAVGDRVEAEDSLVVLESDKASMDVPSPQSGVVKAIKLNVGDKVSEGHDILELEIEGAAETVAEETPAEAAPAVEPAPAPQAPAASAPQAAAAPSVETINVPDIGDDGEVEVIEISVAVGDEIAEEDSLVVLESDKASMEVPSPVAGKVVEILVETGVKVSEGTPVVRVETAGGAVVAAPVEAPTAPAAAPAQAEAPAPVAAPAAGPVRKEIHVPDLSGNSDVPVIEVSVSVGDELQEEDALFVLETDKATMEVPAPFAGKLVEFFVTEGQNVNQGDLVAVMEVMEAAPAQAAASVAASAPAQSAPASAAPAQAPAAASAPVAAATADSGRKTGKVHAGPAVRMIAREFGVDLLDVTPTGPRGRILKEDVQSYVKQVMQQAKSAPKSAPSAAGGAGIPPIPAVDFSQFGEIEEKPMGRLLKAGAMNLHRSWLNVPHVTQFDEADITELEKFRKSMKGEAEKRGSKLTPLPFILKACAYAMQKYPQFNVSLHPDGDKLIHKKYINIGFAVDTPDGLLVPVVRDVDQKSLWELADATADLAGRAQKKQLKADDMKGGCFTISSLGSIGGTAFTPIVNAPEVAILGVSKASIKPVWNGSDFVPRQMLPLSLSYDHRAINGADAARFTAFIAAVLADIRQILM